MTAQIKINGIDRSNNVDPNSVNLQRAMTSQVDTLSFDVIRSGGAISGGFKPDVNDEVEVLEDGTTIFGGVIIKVSSTVDADKVETFNCECKDYSFQMDQKLVVGTYENMTVDDIIADIKTKWLGPAYDLTNVDCPKVVTYIIFNYELVSKVFQQLAELTGYDWYVDQDKKIYFFEKLAISAPFDLTDDNENYYYNSLKITQDIKSLRNSIVVRGGEYLGNEMSEKIIADGVETTFKQAYKYSDVYVKVNTVAQTVGIDYIDDPSLFDCLYNFQEKSVIFPEASKPANGDEVEVGGLPNLPVVIKAVNTASIGHYGEFEYKIIDSTINSKQGARERAQAEIRQYANELSDGTFETKKPGLNVGQKINIQSTIRGINQDYIISRISSKLTNGLEFKHSITLMTSQTYGVIEFFQNLLIEKDKKIIINPDEILEYITAINDSFGMTDSVSASTGGAGPYLWDDAGSIWNFASYS